MTKFLTIASLVLVCGLCACTSADEKRAEELYTAAEAAFHEEQYNHAIALLDSLENSCKKAIEWRKRGHALSYEVQLEQQREEQASADTMLLALNRMINELIESGNFAFEKGEYDELGRFYVRGTEAEKNPGRNYIHATTNEYGAVHLISEFRGSNYLNHTQVRFIGQDGSQMASANVPLTNDGANYHFKHGGVCHETVTYVNDTTLAFIDTHVADGKLRAELLYADGEKALAIRMTDADRNAVVLTYHLGQMLAAQLNCKQRSKTAAGKIQFLQAKMAR